MSRVRKKLLGGCGKVWLFWLATLVLAGTAHSKSPALVIQRVSLFDALTGEVLPHRTVVIEGDRIRAIGTPERPVRVPKGARLMDGRGRYVLPGLIEAHAHLVHQLDFAHVTGDEILPLFLAAGATTVRDAGDEIVAEKLVARYAAAHPELCPRVFLTSPLLDREPPYHRDIGRGVKDPAEVPALVEEMIGWGVTTLKIYDGTERPVGRRLIEEGHRRGLSVIGHLGRYSPLDAVADGIDGLEHIADGSVLEAVFPRTLTVEQEKLPPAERAQLLECLREAKANLDLNSPTAQKVIAFLAARKVTVDPTLAVFRNYLLLMDLPEVHEHPDNNLLPKRLQEYYFKRRAQAALKWETLDQRRRRFRKLQELTGMLYRAGVPLLAGTDTPEPYCPPGFSLHQELELLVESGLPPAAALQAATINNARALKQDQNLGTIAAGKLADLVILSANPLADIRNTRKIERVIKAGFVADPKTLLRSVPME